MPVVQSHNILEAKSKVLPLFMGSPRQRARWLGMTQAFFTVPSFAAAPEFTNNFLAIPFLASYTCIKTLTMEEGIKMQKKRFISLLLILTLALPLIPAVRAAETTAPAQTTEPAQAPTEETQAETEPVLVAEPAAVTAAFLLQPKTLTLTIFTDPKDPSSILSSKEGDPRIYTLFPGRYFYTAVCDGYAPVMDGVLEITESRDPLFFDITLEAIPEEADHYTVTFDPSGGACSVTTAQVQPDGSIGALPIPSREGFSFAGWYQGACYCDPVQEDTLIHGDQTLVAQWSKNENDGVPVRFEPNGGTLPTPLFTAQAQRVNSGSTLSVYDFGGVTVSPKDSRRTMAVAADGRALGAELAVPQDGMLIDSRTDPVTGRPTAGTAFVEAIPDGAYIGFDYESRIISVYDSRDGLLAHHCRVTAGNPYGPLPTPTREGFTFLGWYTAPVGGSPVREQSFYSGSGSPVLYAHWQSECSHVYTSQRQEATCQKPLSILYTCSKCGDAFEISLGQGWSQWSPTRPWNIPETLLEASTEYRFQCLETTESQQSTLPGWQLDSTETVWGSYGAWSGWSLTPAASTDAIQVDTAPLYRYHCFVCGNCQARNPYPGACGCDGEGSTYRELWSIVSHAGSGGEPLPESERYLAASGLTGGDVWYFSAGNLNDTALGTPDANGESPVIRLGYRTRSRAKTTRYRFCRWSDWSDWSQEAPADSPGLRTESRTVYRFYSGPLEAHAYENGACTVCGGKEPS